MAEVVPDADEQQLQHFLSNTEWDEAGVRDQVALDADEILGTEDRTALLIDESGFSKKGVHSVGVARQWNGRLGKTDNCQVGVFAALARGSRATLIDVRLYLPKGWINDSERSKAAGIPSDAMVAKTKPELALEMVRHQRELGVRFSWVGMDGLYGNDPQLLRSLDDDGEVFVADIHKDQRIYLEDPDPTIPQSRRGRRRTKPVTTIIPVEVQQWVKAQPAKAWQRTTIRGSSTGKLRVDVLHRLVWLWDKKEAKARKWHLIVRREIKRPEEIKYSLSNAAEGLEPACLARMQAQRFWIERSFQDGKSHAGLADYQVRGWQPWHRHMVLVMMAMLFMLEEKVTNQSGAPLMTCADIETLLAHFLPQRDIDPDEVIRQMDVRHNKRQASIDQAYRRQELDLQRAREPDVTK